VGIFFSFHTGLSHDEPFEQDMWNFNMGLIKDFFLNKEAFFDYQEKYYGIGSQYITQPIQYIIQKLTSNYIDMDLEWLKHHAKHPVIFLFFFFSSYFFYKILNKITKSLNFSCIGTTFYLLYPYLLGHSFMNPKDIPFLSVWLFLTFYSLNILESYFKTKRVNYKSLLLLSFFTALLISIRVSGILIFLQYFFSFFIFLNLLNINFKYFIKEFPLKILFFSLFTFLFIIILNPLYWHKPYEFFNSILFMGDYYQDVCTLTMGTCVKARSIDSFYVPTWLLFKLPLIILLGLFLFPFIENKLKDKTSILYIWSIVLTSVSIPIVLIIKHVPLYDEIRHIQFLVPLYFLISLSSFFLFKPKMSTYIVSIFCLFFLIENFKIYPYQYTWFNIPARIVNLEKNFELDYWGVSGKPIAEFIEKNKSYDKMCIIGQPVAATAKLSRKNSSKYNCLKPWGAVNSKLERPFLAIQTGRNIKSGLPYNCKIIKLEKINLSFYSRGLTAGKLLICY